MNPTPPPGRSQPSCSVLRPCKKSKGCFRSSAAIAGQLSGDSRSKMQWSVVAWSFLLFSGAVGSDESILQSPKQITVTEGGTVRMNCVVVDKTISSIWSMSWYKDAGTRTVSNERGDYYGRVMKNSSPGTLNESIEITDIKMTETGRYYCRVIVLFGPIYHGHGTEVTVTRTVIQTPSNVNVTEGETVRINCTFVSKTIVAFSWYKDEETRAISNTSGDYYGRVLEINSPGILKESIEITDLKMNDTGTYYCRVTAFTGEIYIGNGTEVTVTRPSLVESPAWGLRWQLLVMGVKLATFIVINVIIVFIILSWESCGFASRRKEA